MSSINGDKSRAGRQRKTRFEKREKSRLLRQSLAAPAVVIAPDVAPKAAPNVAPNVAPVVAAAVIAAAVPVVAAAHLSTKKVIVQYPRKRSE